MNGGKREKKTEKDERNVRERIKLKMRNEEQ